MPHAAEINQPPQAELQVLDLGSGEILSLHAASTERLAVFVTDARDLIDQLQDSISTVGGELLDRLDRGAKWTIREGGYEIKAPSPEAGSSEYPADVLETELRQLIEQGTIDEGAAAAALKRTVTLELRVPFTVSMRTVRVTLQELAQIFVAGEQCDITKVDTTQVAMASGVKALAKIRGVAEILERVKIPRLPAARKVTVKAV